MRTYSQKRCLAEFLKLPRWNPKMTPASPQKWRWPGPGLGSMRHNHIINMCKDLGWCPAHLLVGGRGQCQRDNSVMCGNIASIGELEHVRSWECEGSEMEGEMCTSMCQIRPPKKLFKDTVNVACDTKALIEVSNRIRPTSEYCIGLVCLCSCFGLY